MLAPRSGRGRRRYCAPQCTWEETGLYRMGLLTQVSFPQCLLRPVGHRSKSSSAVRNTRKCSAHFQQRKHDRAGNAARGLIRIAGGEGDRPPQAALSLIQVPGRFQNHVAGEQREGALTDRSHKQIFRGNVFSSQRPGAIDFFAPKLFTDLWDWQIFESSRHHRRFPALSRVLCVGDGGSLRASLPFSPQLAIFGRLTRHPRASTPGFKQLTTTSPSRCIRSSTVSSTAGKDCNTTRPSWTATPHHRCNLTPQPSSPQTPSPPRKGPNSDPSTEEHGPTSAS